MSLFIDIAIFSNFQIKDNHLKKITRYIDLQIEIKRLWKEKSAVLWIGIEAFGVIPKGLTTSMFRDFKFSILKYPEITTFRFP